VNTVWGGDGQELQVLVAHERLDGEPAADLGGRQA
jgi:hypothetical protein